MPEPIDFAIIGAGVAGTYVAWRLAMTGPSVLKRLVPQQMAKPTIRVFEADRVGGRLCSPKMPRMSSRAELGGMRYMEKQLLTSRLVKHLGLRSKQFQYKTLVSHFRGIHSDQKSGNSYRLGVGEKGKDPGQLVEHVIRCALREVVLDHGPKDRQLDELHEVLRKLRTGAAGPEAIAPKQWALLKTHGILHDSRLYDIGFWNLLSYYLSGDAFLFVHDVLGYETIVDNWNAAEAIPWFLRDFTESSFHTIEQGGMEALPRMLFAQFLEQYPSPHPKHDFLLSITQEKDEARLFTLKFENREENVLARHVILAIPKEPLKRLFRPDVSLQSGLGAHDQITALNLAFDSVKAQPLFKLFLAYERAWWEDPRALGRDSGRAITDMPIRQIYYFEPDASQRGMVMASYSDSHYVDFWKALQRRKLEPPFDPLELLQHGELDEPEETVFHRFGANERMVRKAHRQIKQLHPEMAGADSIPEPYLGLAKEWSSDDPVDGALIGGGWHTWVVHAKSWEVMNTMKRPLNSNLYICGEAYSSEQGWIEGALRSAEMALKEIGVPEPDDWIPRTDYRDYGNFEGHDEYIGWSPEK